MNKKQIQHAMLRAETGELGFLGRARLHRALKRNPEAQAEQQAWRDVQQLYKNLPHEEWQPSAFTLNRIQEAAYEKLNQQAAPETTERRGLGIAMHPTLAVAASILLLAFSGWFLVRVFQDTSAPVIAEAPQPAERYSEASLSAMYEEIEATYVALQDALDSAASGALQLGDYDDPDELALQLLVWEDS